MNTVKMIKMWEEDTNRKFKCVDSKNKENIGGIISKVGSRLCWDEDYDAGLFISTDNTLEWELIIEDVDFITAYNNCLNSKKPIKYRGKDYIEDFLDGRGNGTIHTITKDIYGELKLTQKWILQK